MSEPQRSANQLLLFEYPGCELLVYIYEPSFEENIIDALWYNRQLTVYSTSHEETSRFVDNATGSFAQIQEITIPVSMFRLIQEIIMPVSTFLRFSAVCL